MDEADLSVSSTGVVPVCGEPEFVPCHLVLQQLYVGSSRRLSGAVAYRQEPWQCNCR